MLKKEDVLAFLVLTLVSLFAIRPLFHTGLYTAHDIWHQVARLYHYNQAIKDGQIFPMWIGQLAHGYGYPLFIFSYHFPWFISVPLMWLGMPLFAALKLNFMVSVIISGFSMFLLVKMLTKRRIAAFAAASVYVWAPYHFLTLYVSASVGTAWAFALVPMMMIGIWWIVTEKSWRGSLTLAFSFAALVLTHLMTTVMIAPLLLFWGLGIWCIQHPSLKENIRILIHFFVSAVMGLCLTAFYVVPLLIYLPLIRASEEGSGFKGLYQSNLVYLKQLIYSRWGFGPIIARAIDGEISFQVGIIQWIGVLWLTIVVGISCVQILRKKNRDAVSQIFSYMLVLLGFSLCVCLMITQAAPVWKIIDTVYTVDYPFRLLLMAVVFGSLALGYVVSTFKQKTTQFVLTILLLCIAWYTNRNHVRVNEYTDVPLQLYIDSETTTNTFHEYTPKGYGVPKDIVGFPASYTPRLTASQLKERAITAYPFATFSAQNIKQTTTTLAFDVDIATTSAVGIRSFGFPQIFLTVDGIPRKYELDSEGVLFTDLDKGIHQIKVEYRRASWVKLAALVSILSFGGALLWIGYLIVSPKQKAPVL